MSIQGLDDFSEDKIKVVTLDGVTFELDSKVKLFSKMFDAAVSAEKNGVIEITESKSHVTSECMKCFIEFINLHDKLEDFPKPPKPSQPVLSDGYKNKVDLDFFTHLSSYENVHLLHKMIQFASYIDCEILFYNCCYTLSSLVKRSGGIKTIQILKANKIIPMDKVYDGTKVKELHDDPLPSTLILPDENLLAQSNSASGGVYGSLSKNEAAC